MPYPYEGQRRKVFFYYRQVAGNPPAAPLGPHDCEDVHVRIRPIRLSTAEREESLPLSKSLKLPARCDNRNAHDNKDDSNDDDGINTGGDRGDDGMHPTFPITQNNGEGGEVQPVY